jgi:alpha-L-rhamnosidase
MKYYHLIISFLLLSQSSFSQSDNQLEIVKLLCNHTENPTVSNISGLNFSWQLQSALRNQSQSAYRILVADNLDDVKNLKGKIWDSKKVVSDKSILVHYNGKRLNPAHQYFWKVKVWDQDGIESEWSDAGTFQTGLFSVTDWGNAQWIGYEEMPAELKLVPGVHGNGNDQGQKALQRPVVPLFRKKLFLQRHYL